MLEIDGIKGGGQILRTSIGLSALTGIPIRIKNIRKGKPKTQGLMVQHLEGILAVAKLCGAEVTNARIGSTEIEFVPKEIRSEDLEIKISTAGSISLLFQSLQIPAAFGEKEIKIKIKGGSTASSWSPPVHYTQNVFLPIVRKMGYEAEINIIKEGFYPKGGAEVEIFVKPVKKLSALELIERGEFKEIEIFSVVGSLDESICDREIKHASKHLTEKGFPKIVSKKKVERTFSQGNVLNIFSRFENTVLGSNSLGERGMLAEKVAEESVEGIIKSINSNSCLDKHMSDQIIPFIALAEGKSKIKIEEMTEHITTNIEITEKILGVKFSKENNILEVDGIRFNIK